MTDLYLKVSPFPWIYITRLEILVDIRFKPQHTRVSAVFYLPDSDVSNYIFKASYKHCQCLCTSIAPLQPLCQQELHKHLFECKPLFYLNRSTCTVMCIIVYAGNHSRMQWNSYVVTVCTYMWCIIEKLIFFVIIRNIIRRDDKLLYEGTMIQLKCKELNCLQRWLELVL